MKLVKIFLLLLLFQNIGGMEQLSNGILHPLPEEITKIIIICYVLKPPFLKEGYTQEDCFEFAKQTVAYQSSLPKDEGLHKTVFLCNCTCKLWNRFVAIGNKNYFSLYENMYLRDSLFSGASILSYITNNSLCDMTQFEKVHYHRIHPIHKTPIQTDILNVLNKQSKRMHLLFGMSSACPERETKTTFLHCVTFPKNYMAAKETVGDINFHTYFLFTAKEDALLAETSRNQNGDFTFEGFFSFLHRVLTNKKTTSFGKQFLAEEKFITDYEEKVYNLKEVIEAFLQKGGICRHGLLLKNKNAVWGNVLHYVDGRLTEIVKVTVPIEKVSLGFFNTVLRPMFVTNDGYTVEKYCVKDKISTESCVEYKEQ